MSLCVCGIDYLHSDDIYVECCKKKDATKSATQADCWNIIHIVCILVDTII